MKSIQSTGLRRKERKRYRFFVSVSLLFSLLAIVVIVVLQTLGRDNVPNQPAMHFLGSKFNDIIVFTSLLAIATALFGASAVAMSFDIYRKTFEERHEDTIAFINSEAFLDVFETDADPRFVSLVLESINQCSEEILAAGLGLGFLTHNTNLLNAIKNRIQAKKGLNVRLFYGSNVMPGVKARVEEEKAWHSKKGFDYDAGWVDRYPATITNRITEGLSATDLARYSAQECKFVPLLSVLKIDDIIFASPYGAPDLRGADSPWLVLDGLRTDSRFVRFALRYLQSAEGGPMP